MIFTSDPVKFSYIGEVNEAEHPMTEFAFEAPLERSHYTYTGRFRGITAYEGTFLVDRKTLDLVRLTIRTKELPQESGACEAATTVDYQIVRLNNSNLLLPSVVRLAIVDTNGNENVNKTVFSACREFHGESVVNFGDAASGRLSNSPASNPGELVIRKGLLFEVALTQDIDTSKAAAGDTIRCELATSIQDGRKLVAPAGTPVTGRIVELRRIYGPPSSVSLGFRLESMHLDGAVRTLTARTRGGSQRPRPRSASVSQLRTDEDRQLTVAFPDPKGNLLIQNGLKTKWITGL